MARKTFTFSGGLALNTIIGDMQQTMFKDIREKFNGLDGYNEFWYDLEVTGEDTDEIEETYFVSLHVDNQSEEGYCTIVWEMLSNASEISESGEAEYDFLTDEVLDDLMIVIQSDLSL